MENLTWIEGTTRSGKTAQLLAHLSGLAERDRVETGTVFLMFAANGDNRLVLADRLAETIPASVPVTTSTPAGFIQNEVALFWPVLVEALGLSPQFPMKLRPENEQELATQVWRSELEGDALLVPGWTEAQTVRRSLDFLLLAANSGIPAEDLSTLLPEGMPNGIAPVEVWEAIAQAIVTWRDWCLKRGFLTYSIATELYWRYLLPHSLYLEKFTQRFCGVLADDLDEYPAIFRMILAHADSLGLPTAITWNPYGKVRLGVGADPGALEKLRNQATVLDDTSNIASDTIAATWGELLVTAVLDPVAVPEPIEAIQVIQSTSRGELLRRTAEAIAQAIQQEAMTPGEIAVIGPGFDAIARYTLAEILQKQGIPVVSLNDQRPLVSTPLVRSVLTLIPFIYSGLGRFLDKDAVAEMLVVLSQSAQGSPNQSWFERVQIDPVRAELIVDHCFQPDLEHPDLLEVTEFPRWDRLGYQATEAYNTLREWIAQQRQARQQRLITSPVSLIDRAIQSFLWRGNYLPYDQLAALRELVETAQHFWEVQGRLQLQRRFSSDALDTELSPEGRFLHLLRQGIVTANPFPVKPLEQGQQGITLSTVFQYRSQRLTHRWQFWLDAGSPRWLTGTDALFGYPIFLEGRQGRPWTADFIEQSHEARLERILRDLLGRATEQVILCHSDLAVNGQEQTGPLLTLIDVAEEWSLATLETAP
ncbi:recombinase family protein [Oscillatoria sp. CS-180]|uniref:recombinase family protein n=1 Tax=Oscillatoria sp. CS-180 TaxID=3021720 RepID=UPI00232DAB02|nr:recombinase family protein [Oscillatoria sp. CS-180]MDB9528006.1 recombinase family protein [Oscillatoria sp. CS-180]